MKLKLGKHVEGLEDGLQVPSEEALTDLLKTARWEVPEGHVEVETYPLKPPFSYAHIVQNKDTAEHLYVVDGLPLSREERETYLRSKKVLERELKAPLKGEELAQAFQRQLPGILNEHKDLLRGVTYVGSKKVMYCLEQDIVGLGKIDPLMFDPYVEDISCSGANRHIFLWHRHYENIKTNIYFEDDDELDDFVMKVVHKSGRHVSVAFPIVDATLPGKHRLAVSYKRETTPYGTSFTIRKFRSDPFTIIDLIQAETMSKTMAAYLWMLIENKVPLMIIGATGAGKTTALNAIACLVPSNYKIVTVEEVSEVNLPHENWVSTIARSGFGVEDKGEITLFDLIKSAIRHRPDLIIVGEVRGDEAYVLFQALATGHGGLCTMHAEDIGLAIKRLTQPPMNIPSSIIPLMNCALLVKHVRAPVFLESGRRLSSRKIIQVSEIEDVNAIHEVFSWDAPSDSFKENLADSFLLTKMAGSQSLPVENVLKELERREDVLQWMAERNARDYRSVNSLLSKYYYDPRSVYEEISEE